MTDVLGYQGKNVVITGAASGMGQAAAQLLVDLGANVYALDIADISVAVTQSIVDRRTCGYGKGRTCECRARTNRAVLYFSVTPSQQHSFKQDLT